MKWESEDRFDKKLDNFKEKKMLKESRRQLTGVAGPDLEDPDSNTRGEKACPVHHESSAVNDQNLDYDYK